MLGDCPLSYLCVIQEAITRSTKPKRLAYSNSGAMRDVMSILLVAVFVSP